MHCPGHNTKRGSQLAREGWYFRRVKNNVPYFTGIIPFSDCGEFAASLVSGVVSFMVEGRVGFVKG